MWSRGVTYNAGSRNLSYNFFDISVDAQVENNHEVRMRICVTCLKLFLGEDESPLLKGSMEWGGASPLKDPTAPRFFSELTGSSSISWRKSINTVGDLKIVNFRQLALMYLIFVIDFEFVPRALEALQFHFAGAVTSFDADSLCSIN